MLLLNHLKVSLVTLELLTIQNWLDSIWRLCQRAGTLVFLAGEAPGIQL